MEVVEIRSEAKSLDSTFDILLDMSGRIRDTRAGENVEAALRGNFEPR